MGQGDPQPPRLLTQTRVWQGSAEAKQLLSLASLLQERPTCGPAWEMPAPVNFIPISTCPFLNHSREPLFPQSPPNGAYSLQVA